MHRWNYQLKTVLLLGALSAVLIAIGGMLGTTSLYVFTVLAVVLNLSAYFLSDRLVLRLHRAHEVGPAEAPRLHQSVADLAQAAGIPKPRVFWMDDDHANAFATGRNPKHGVVAVTRGIVELLTPRELRAVLAHELAHIRNRDILVATIAAAIAAVVTYSAQALQFSALFGGAQQDDEHDQSSTGSGLLLALVAPLAAMLIQLGVSRSRELHADETGAIVSGDPLGLASALEKLEQSAEAISPDVPQPATASLFIVNPLRAGSWTMNLFSTHPATTQRVHRLLGLARKWQRVAA